MLKSKNINDKIILLYTTIDSLHKAEELAYKALDAGYATCVNIIQNCISYYFWEGKINKGVEYYLLFKTTSNSIHDLESFIIENHSYDIPAILKFETYSYDAFYNYIKTGNNNFT